MLLNKRFHIAYNLLKKLKESSGVHQVKDLAPALGTTINHLEQVGRLLTKHQLIDVSRGPGGGYRYKQQTTADNLYRIFEKSTRTYSELNNKIIELLSKEEV